MNDRSRNRDKIFMIFCLSFISKEIAFKNKCAGEWFFVFFSRLFLYWIIKLTNEI